MFRISPSNKDAIQIPAVPAVPIDPVTQWTNDHNFAFPPVLTFNDEFHHHPRFKEIREVPKVGYPLYHLISQYNPWLDCEMTREKRAFLAPRVGEFCCPMNLETTYSAYHGRSVPNFFRNETVLDILNLYLWPLLHSRADEVVACRTFADWRHLFEQTISLAFPDYEYWVSVACVSGGVTRAVSSTFIPVSDQRRTARILKYMTPARVLYFLTTRANLWPYGATAQQYGVCSIKPKIKEYNDKTTIDWLVGVDFLRKMKRVHIYFTPIITSSSNPSSTLISFCDTDNE